MILNPDNERKRVIKRFSVPFHLHTFSYPGNLERIRSFDNPGKEEKYSRMHTVNLVV